MSDKEKASKLKDQGDKALNAGNFDEVVKCYTDAMKIGGILNPFQEDEVIAKLLYDPRTKHLFNDKSFLKLLVELQENPSMFTMIRNPRVLTALSVLLSFNIYCEDRAEIITPPKQKPSKHSEETMDVEFSPEKQMISMPPTPPVTRTPSPTDLHSFTETTSSPEKAAREIAEKFSFPLEKQLVLKEILNECDVDTLLIVRPRQTWMPPAQPAVSADDILNALATWRMPPGKRRDNWKGCYRWIFHLDGVLECRDDMFARFGQIAFGLSVEAVNKYNGGGAVVLGPGAVGNSFAEAAIISKLGNKAYDVLYYDFFGIH